MDDDSSRHSVAQFQQQLQTLSQASCDLNAELESGAILRTLVSYGIKLVDATSGGAGLCLDGKMVFSEYCNNGDWQPVDFQFDSGEGVPGWVLDQLKPFISDDCPNEPQVIPEIQQALGFNTLVNVPMLGLQGELFGCLELHNKKDAGSFTQQDIGLLQGLAASAATALENARILQEKEVTQRALEKSEERFVYSQRFANIGTWDWDIRSGEIYWSDRIAPLFGYAPGELETTYENFLSAVHEDDRQAVIEAVNNCVEKGADYEIEHRVVWPDGSMHWVLERGDVVRDDAGEALHMLGVVQDISRRKAAEDALCKQRDFAEGLIETAQVIVLVLDTHGCIVRFNPYMEEISGYSLQEVKGKDWFECFLPKQDHHRHRELFKRASGDIQTRGNVNPIITKHGALREIEWYDKTLKDDDGNTLGLLAVGQDITQRLEVESALRDSEQLFRGLVESTNDWVWEVDRHGEYTYASPQVERILGYKPAALIGKQPFDFMPPEEAQKIGGIFKEIVDEQRAINNLENINLHCSGKQVILETSGVPFFDRYGNFMGYRGIDRDITERKQLYEELQLAALVLDNTPEGMMITDSDLKIIKVNPAFVRTTGYSEEEVLGKTPKILSSNRHDEAFYQAFWDSINLTGQWQGEIWNRRKDGEIYPEWLNINVIHDDDGKIKHYAGIFSDISTQEHVRRQLHDLAYYDALTGLPNRELFQDRLKNAIAQAKRQEDAVGLMFLDLDRFKAINDSLGHRTGDDLLKAVAKMLTGCVRDSDTVARLGGDEFIIILPGVKQDEDVAKVAEKIINTMDMPFHMPDGHEIYASTSIGISLYPADGHDLDTLLKNADTAMYRAKQTGAKSYKFYTGEMSARFAERLMLENELRKAIDTQSLSLAYQPQVDISNGRILGFEVLARWHHDEMGWVSPAQFIPIAEEAGLIIPIGDWVMRQACLQLKEWQQQFSPELKMAINLSGQQVYQEGLVDKILSLLEETNLPPHTLELELTETTLIENIDTAIITLTELSRCGIHLAIDDFGTGYSSLSYLKRFDIHKLKIDQSFVHDISSDTNDAEIVTTIIVMANNLHLDVIAEGVETREQLDYLLENGCKEVQSFYYSPPKPAEVITGMLTASDCIVPVDTDNWVGL